MTSLKKFLALTFLGGFVLSAFSVVSAARFEGAIQEATAPIQQHLEGAGFAGAQGGAEGARDVIIAVAQKIIIPAIIIVGVLMSILGFYEIMTAEKDDAQKKGSLYVLW